MDRGRILILGQTKEHTYEVRNLLDRRTFEIEIALSPEVAKNVLTQRYMNLLVLHTEVADEAVAEFFSYVEERAVDLPLLVFGEDTTRFRDRIPPWMAVYHFEKPYAVDEVHRCIEGLEVKSAMGGIEMNPYS